MLPNLKKNKTFSVMEFFFVEKALELVHAKTIDSHRVRQNNPYTILKELANVLQDWHDRKIKSFDTVKAVMSECKKLLEDESVLIFDKVGKEYFTSMLEETKEQSYKDCFYCTKILIEENKGYVTRLFGLVQTEIKRIDVLPANFEYHELQTLNISISYLISDLIDLGYSKSYIHHILYALFSHSSKLAFNESFEGCKNFPIKGKENYHVIFKIKLPKELESSTHFDSIKLSEEIRTWSEPLNDKTKAFFLKTSHNYNFFISKQVNVYDYFTAVKVAKKDLASTFDLIHMGFSHPGVKLFTHTLVIGEREPSKANTKPIFFTTDGTYKSGEDNYKEFSDKLKRVFDNQKISKETKEKLKAAIRYLRLGNESIELEQRFLNYWIGIEFLFSNYSVEANTFNRIKEYFSITHALIYIVRNLYEFHNDISRLEVSNLVQNYAPNLEYLLEPKTYDGIIKDNHDAHPLLCFRAYEMKRDLFNSGRRKKMITNHKANLENHLTRIYRIRNEIVHDASTDNNIEGITSNLRYYLTFIINEIFVFLLNNPIDANFNSQISIEDMLVIRKIQYSSLSKDDFKLEKMIRIKNTFELFS